PSFPTLLEQIVTSMTLLVQKTGTLNDSWAGEKEQIAGLLAEVEQMEDSDDILAAKFEQDILGKITALSSACDCAIAGKKDADVEKALAALASSVNQRKAVKMRVDAE
ncbi:MAG: hypothetical protein J5817_06345, partial [Treponema sp.]|nr:hypothetical protein [Treponema sp.]